MLFGLLDDLIRFGKRAEIAVRSADFPLFRILCLRRSDARYILSAREFDGFVP